LSHILGINIFVTYMSVPSQIQGFLNTSNLHILHIIPVCLIVYVLLAHLAEGHGSLCHGAASVVRPSKRLLKNH